MSSIEAIKGSSSMAYQGSTAIQNNKSDSMAKTDTSNQAATGNETNQAVQANAVQSTADTITNTATQQSNNTEAVQKAIAEINKQTPNSMVQFGIDDRTNRITIKVLDKDTKEVIREFPAEKTLDIVAKVMEMAGLLVDEKR